MGPARRGRETGSGAGGHHEHGGADEALLSGILVPEKVRLKSRGCFADGVPATNVRTKHCLRGSRRDK